jgi:3-hydroxyacyl-CoA dehydrogenase
MKEINKVTVLGIGVLGSQIAYQTAYCDFDVVAYDIGEEALRLAKERVVNLQLPTGSRSRARVSTKPTQRSSESPIKWTLGWPLHKPT